MVMLSGFGASSWLVGGGLAIFSSLACVYGPGLRRPQIPRGLVGGFGGDPNHPRLPRTASLALMCRCQKVVPLSLVAPFPPGWNNPQVIQKQLSKLIDGLFLCCCC